MTALSACNDEDTFAAQPDAACLQVNATMAGASTRAAIEGTELPQGAQIGVSVFNSDGSNYNGKSDGCLNIPYTRQTGWETRNPISLSHTVGKAVAYYPYSPGVGDISTIPVETESQTDYLYSDWVNDLTYQNNQADFSMNHALCAIQLNLVNESYEADKGEVTSLAVTSDDLATKGTLNAMTGALSAFSGQGTRIAVNKTFLLSKEVQSTKIIGIPTGHRGLEARRHPDLTVEVTIDGKRNKLTVPMAKAFEQGMAYEVNMKVKDTQNPLELVSVTVKPWVEEILGDVDMYQDNAYIIQVKIPRDGFEFGTNATNFTGTIDWGDGTELDSYTYKMKKPWHTYAKAGTYTIVHKGKTEKLEFAYTKSNSPACLRDILYIGKDLGINNMTWAFSDCFNLQNLRPGIFDNLTQVTDFWYTFEGCRALTAIPAGLFDNCALATDFVSTFKGCSKLTNIPQGLFDHNTQVTSFGSTFSGCSKLTNIPQGLFDHNTQVTEFWNTFSGCSKLTNIPQGLFDHNTQVTNFNNTFRECAALTVIPTGLFDNCPLVTSFIGTFYECSKLTNIPQGLFKNNKNAVFSEKSYSYWEVGTFSKCSSLTEIPQGLFDNCPNATSFRGVFYNCSNLVNIPAGLFDNCTKVTDFNHTFYGCSKLTNIPQGLFDNCALATDFVSTFEGCSKLTNIPQGLFDHNTQVTNFNNTFTRCYSLATIPQGLFDNNTQVTSFRSTFWNANIATIPQGLFDNCTLVTSFSSTFERCSALTSIPAGLFDKNTQVTNFGNTFSGCSNLTTIPQGLFDKNTLVTNFGSTFYKCSSLTTVPVGLFDNCRQATEFGGTFEGCSALTGESPYTLIDGQKVHLYERVNYPKYFSVPDPFEKSSSSNEEDRVCFKKCTSLTDYDQMPKEWKML